MATPGQTQDQSARPGLLQRVPTWAWPIFAVVLVGIVLLVLYLASGGFKPNPDKILIPQSEQPPTNPQTTTRTTDGARMVYIPAGRFVMGSSEGWGYGDEYPQHVVNLDGYWIDHTEVTHDRYDLCVRDGVCSPPGTDALTLGDVPMTAVTWFQARDYCQWAGARLPTEAEWEKAARGTDRREFPWGNIQPGCEYAVMEEDEPGCGRDSTWPVGSKPKGASPYGILDMAGNALEWAADYYSFDYYTKSPVRNPQGSETGRYRVLRGGSFNVTSDYLRTATRYWYVPETQYDYVGFRCASSLDNIEE
jgi:formylglycine-generating enzyme required for sulfatase activity